MGTSCKHGIDSRYCAICKKVNDIEDLYADALRRTADGSPIIVLREIMGTKRFKVMSLDEDCSMQELDASKVHSMRPVKLSSAAGQRQLEQFGTLALNNGFLFQPGKPLTQREQMDEGPAKCYQCKTAVSYDGGSFGCMQCGNYVCRCGSCMCGYPGGKNYRDEWIPAQPPPPCRQEDRREYVRVARFVHRYLR